ncbi:ribose-phosphate diphosphokinase [Candidatus Woesearchaeota archaeon]|nr:ribose-phosphate diphosphokinase [Candidatus Woesearchaeota archaeon]
MIITSCGNSKQLALRIARKLNVTYSPLTISAFPDGDTYLKFNAVVKGKDLVLVQSFQPSPEKSLLSVIWAAETAKDLGAKRVILVAPYLAYLRQDKRFHPGEAVSSRIMAKHLNSCINKIVTLDPHLHRYRSLKDIFTISTVKLTANKLIGHYIQNRIKDPVIIGPDWESYQWAEVIAREVGCEHTVLEKTRFSSRRVASRMVKDISLRGKDVIIVDDIISTGKTMIEALKKAQKAGAKSITAIGVHGLFVEKGLEKMKKAGFDQIITTNCIEHPTNRIDVMPLIVEELKKERRKR